MLDAILYHRERETIGNTTYVYKRLERYDPKEVDKAKFRADFTQAINLSAMRLIVPTKISY